MEALMEEFQEARRMKLLNQPSKVMDIEHALRALRIDIREKFTVSFQLQKELLMNQRAEENKYLPYKIKYGSESLGSILRVQSCSDEAIELTKCSIQWHRLSSECSRREPILGADKFVYAPEPIDVGRVLQVDVLSNGQKVSVTTAGPIDPAAGLQKSKSNSEFEL